MFMREQICEQNQEYNYRNEQGIQLIYLLGDVAVIPLRVFVSPESVANHVAQHQTIAFLLQGCFPQDRDLGGGPWGAHQPLGWT